MPSNPQLKRFRTTQDWHDYISPLLQSQSITPAELHALRLNVYEEIKKIRGNPILVYASKFIDGVASGTPNQIDLSDIDGFTDLINSIPEKEKKIDVIIHSPGGRPDATERIVSILRNRFEQVSFLIPHSAYSASTMLALSGDEIILHPSATLGPVDPQIALSDQNGTMKFVPAKSILNGFNKAKQKIKKEGPETLPAYLPLIEKYSLDLFEFCEDSEKLSKELVKSWLKTYMFKGKKVNGQKLKKIVSYFSNYNAHKIHSRPLTFDKLKNLDLNISLADGELRELLWESYILLNGFFNISAFVKLFENTEKLSWGRQFSQNVQKPKKKK